MNDSRQTCRMPIRLPSVPCKSVMSGHIVLLGDSIFDNGSYVPGGVSVIEHVRQKLPANSRASLMAVDGARIVVKFEAP